MGNNKSKTVNITTETVVKEETIEGAGKVGKIEESDFIKPEENGEPALGSEDNKNVCLKFFKHCYF